MANANLEQEQENQIKFYDKKLWGEKEVLNINDTSQLDFLIINKGGYCSKHKHFHKYNLFYVVTGVLKITLYLKDGGVRDYIIGDECPKRKFIVRPGTFHKFKALEDTECIEFSYVKYSSEDIVREDTGGIA